MTMTCDRRSRPRPAVLVASPRRRLPRAWEPTSPSSPPASLPRPAERPPHIRGQRGTQCCWGESRPDGRV